MKKYYYCFVLGITASVHLACQRKTEIKAPAILTFETPVVKPIVPLIPEVSGIADSKKNPGFLWAQEDSGNPPNLILISHDGQVSKTIPLMNATNYDWEDMVLAGDQLYVADIGDNSLTRNEYVIYQFTEPADSIDVVQSYKKIQFKYPDGKHDAEALLVDPATKDIYIITKQDNPSRIYKLSFPQSLTELNTVTNVGSLSFSGVVSAALSADAKNIIIKTYVGLHLYQRKGNEAIPTILAGTFTKLNYQMEPQGEAVAFAADQSGFYTLSEKGLSKSVNLYFYRAK